MKATLQEFNIWGSLSNDWQFKRWLGYIRAEIACSTSCNSQFSPPLGGLCSTRLGSLLFSKMLHETQENHGYLRQHLFLLTAKTGEQLSQHVCLGAWEGAPGSVAMATRQVQGRLLVVLGVGSTHPWGFWEGFRQRWDWRCLFPENVSGFIKALCRLLRLVAVLPQVTMSLCSTTWRTFPQTRTLSCTKPAC